MKQPCTPSISDTGQKVIALNSLELTSLHALLAYKSYETNISEDHVRRAVLARFGVDELKNLPCTHYDEAIRFLVDLPSDLILH